MRGGQASTTRIDLSTLLETHRRDVSARIFVKIPGEIFSYNATKRTATIQPSPLIPDPSGILVPMPLLQNVPVYTMQGGGIHVSFPIEIGDECSVFFADRDVSNWKACGGQQRPAHSRRHSLADGFALVGPNSQANPLITFLSAGEGGLASAAAKVAITASDTVVIKNAVGSLGTLIASLFSAIDDASKAAMEALKAQFQAVLAP